MRSEDLGINASYGYLNDFVVSVKIHSGPFWLMGVRESAR